MNGASKYVITISTSLEHLFKLLVAVGEEVSAVFCVPCTT
jgi:hypothetical protein